MADIRVTNGDGDTLPAGAPAAGMNRAPETDPEHLLAEHAGPGTPGMVAGTDDPEVVRKEIEQTRARMSETIDSLETALIRKKEQIEERLDVTAPVRERVRSQPWLFAGGALAAGLALGYVTGEPDADDAELDLPRGRKRGRGDKTGNGRRAIPTMEIDLETGEADAGPWKSRADQWERRARKLMKTCNRQERELHDLRASLAVDEDSGGGLTGAISGLVSGTVSRLVGGDRAAQGEMEVEVELEEPHGTPHPYYDAPETFVSPAAEGEMEVEVELEEPSRYYGSPQPAYGAQPAYGRGEMEVEVELEEHHRRGGKGVLLGVVGAVVTAGVAGAVARFFAGRKEEEIVAEVELEQPRPVAQATYPPPPTTTTYTAATDVEVDVDRTLMTPGTYETYETRAPGGELEVEVDLEPRDRPAY